MSSERFATVTTEEYEKIMKEKNSDVHPMSNDMLLQQSSSQSITKSSSSLKKMQKCLLETCDGVTFNNCAFGYNRDFIC